MIPILQIPGNQKGCWSQELAAAAMEVESRKRRLPKGTSAYQAAWILDNDFSDEETEEVDLASPSTASAPGHSLQGTEAEPSEWDEDMDDGEVRGQCECRAFLHAWHVQDDKVRCRHADENTPVMDESSRDGICHQ